MLFPSRPQTAEAECLSQVLSIIVKCMGGGSALQAARVGQKELASYNGTEVEKPLLGRN